MIYVVLKYLTFNYSNKETQLVRLMTRNGYTEGEALQRINAQLPLVDKCMQASHVIDNSGSQESTREQVLAIYKELRQSRAHWKWRLVTWFGITMVTGLLTWASYELFQYLRR